MQIRKWILLGAILGTGIMGMQAAQDGIATTDKKSVEQKSPSQYLAGETVQGIGFYIGGGIAGTVTQDLGYSAPNVDPGFTVNADKKDSYGGLLELKAGYDWSIADVDPNFIIGTELNLDFGGKYLENTVQSNDPSLDGSKVKTGIAEGDVIIGFRVGYNLGPCRPYVGVGGGLAILGTLDPKFDNGSDSVKLSTATTVAPVYRGVAGVDFFIAKDWALNLEYRYQVVSDVKFSSGKEGEIDCGDLKSHQLELGVKTYF